MQRAHLPRWILQSAIGIALVGSLNLVFGAPAPAPQAQTAAVQSTAGDRCAPGFSGSPEKGCTDINECSVNNGGCSQLAACMNTKGSRECSPCPPDFAGNGYIGCFDVNECPAKDCSAKFPAGGENAPPPEVTTSGDVTVGAGSTAGAAATFTASAKDSIDGARPAHCLPKSGSSFPVGKTTVSCWATNKRGKIGNATLVVNVTATQ
jgi:hypothetical protein